MMVESLGMELLNNPDLPVLSLSLSLSLSLYIYIYVEPSSQLPISHRELEDEGKILYMNDSEKWFSGG